MKATKYHQGMHLANDMLLPEEKQCPFCSFTDRKRTIDLQKNPEVFLFQCENCFAVSASKMPTKEALDFYYSNYYKEGKKNTIGNAEDMAKHIYKNIYKHLLVNKLETINILDFGGGDAEISVNLGEYLLTIETVKEINIALVDYNNVITSIDNKKIKVKHYFDLMEIDNQQYDIIIASAIIEHLLSPGIYLKKLFALLSAGGIFYARTPYILPLLKRFKYSGLDFTYPAHLHDLGQKFWENILCKLRLQDKYIIIKSRPSIVETAFKFNFFRTLIAYILKSPWYILGEKYKIVGGWEIYVNYPYPKGIGASKGA
jgi:2-polyprenyl-3-methyl-5-hydroxy-6-metoxy-1,4-benzoquinol methylase